MKSKTCVDKSGRFKWGVHQPGFKTANFRINDSISVLGKTLDDELHENHANFPPGTVVEPNADLIFEIPNAFPFRGTTYICKSWADQKAGNPSAIGLPKRPAVSFSRSLAGLLDSDYHSELDLKRAVAGLPDPMRLALASTSTDPHDLVCLAEFCCDFIHDETDGEPIGLRYRKDAKGRVSAVISDHILFETLVNNPDLPDSYKEVMVLKPGVQGRSEIVGEWVDEDNSSHIFEYLRRNSYIPWGHYAANMSHDAIRYDVRRLSRADMTGLRHLYYQRTYARLAQQFDLTFPDRRSLTAGELEDLRKEIVGQLNRADAIERLEFNRTLWGWNYGFDFAPTHYRLHASHQQIHQQFAMIPALVSVLQEDAAEQQLSMPAYGCGDLIADFAEAFRIQNGVPFFDCLIEAIQTNRRTDGEAGGPTSLVIYRDEHVMLFVPKAQTSQWELQLITLQKVGNIVEADLDTRSSIDLAILTAVRVLSGMGARMITSIEFPKSIDAAASDQRLLYSFLPKLPESPGAFSEAQLRWINGHYPEDFAEACRLRLQKMEPV